MAVYFCEYTQSESESHSVVSNSCDPMDYTVHGILQARTLEWVAVPFYRGSSQPRAQTQVSLIAGRFFLDQLSHQGSPEYKQNYCLKTLKKAEFCGM